MPHPLELPEILRHISQYLQPHDLLHSIQVNHLWHKTFLCPLWNTHSIHHLKTIRNASKESFHKHAHFIRNLCLYSRLESKHYDCQTLIHLESLLLYRTDEPRLATLPGYIWVGEPAAREKAEMEGHHRELEKIFQRNPGIKELEISSNLKAPGSTFWGTVIDLPRLTKLAVKGLKSEPSPVGEWFWRACHRIQVLELRDVIVEQDTMIHLLEKNQLREISLWGIVGINIQEQFEILTACRQLRSISWEWIPSRHVTGKDFVAELAKGTWPSLESVDLDGSSFTDACVKGLLDGMDRVIELQLPGSTLGVASMAALKSHFETLVKIDLQGAISAPSGFAQMILSSCPRLKWMHGESLTAMDVLKGKPWVCLSLERLIVDIQIPVYSEGENDQGKEDDFQHCVFTQISRLTKLEILQTLVMDVDPSEGQQCRHLDFRLGKGIELLSTLKSLRVLGIPEGQQMTDEEVEWMIRHWTGLQSVSGSMNKVDEDKRLKDMLRAKGMCY